MAVKFILGKSGTGKTTWCINQLVDALNSDRDQSLILLVPEQATYQAEQAILAQNNVQGYHRLRILSFDRLQFLLLGKNTTHPALSKTGRQMIIHRILRANAQKLKIFGSSADRPGLAQKMAQTITELNRYAKTPEDLEDLTDQITKQQQNSLAAMKFSDIALIFNDYQKYIEEKFIDPDTQLTQACRAVSKADFLKNANLWIDGFAGFTNAEMAMLIELLKTATDTQIALCLDPARIDPANPHKTPLDPISIFNPTEQTYVQLFEIIKKSKQKLEKPVILNDPVRFADSEPLAHIENSIFGPQTPEIKTDDSIRIISAPNARAEVKFVADQILKLVKEKKYRYRDIAVIASDIDNYQHYIQAHFNDCDIPFFIDKRKPLTRHPGVHLICSALQSITGGFTRHDVFSYLKSDFVPIPRTDIDTLENYCIAFGTTGSDFQSENDFSFAGDENPTFDEKQINNIRRQAISPLLDLQTKLCKTDSDAKINAADFTKYFFDFLDQIQLRQTLAKWIANAIEKNDHAAADEHRQFYDRLLNIFDELTEIFSDQDMDCIDFQAILNNAFSQLTLAFIPPTLDQVLVGSIERSRHPDLKAAFLIGSIQKLFPTPMATSGILTDDDRNLAESANFELAPSSRQRLIERQYLAYIAFTRPSRHLYVSYPIADEKGAPQSRSQFILNLESLFENLNEEPITNEYTDLEQINTLPKLTDLLCCKLGKDNLENQKESQKLLYPLLKLIENDDQLNTIAQAVKTALNYDNRASLDKQLTQQLFTKNLKSSATRLSTFAACPYKHFARYILKLQPRKEFKLEPLDLGNFYHTVLDKWIKAINTKNLDLATTDNHRLIEILKKQIDQLVQTDTFISNFKRRSPHNAFIIQSASETLADCAKAIIKIIRAGDFRPLKSEIAFGQARDAAESLGQYNLKLPHDRTLTLNGKIDRLDTTDIDGRTLAVVFDYKRTAKSFAWADFFHGLNIQLPIYISAVNSATNKNIDCIGAFFFPVEISPASGSLSKLTTTSQRSEYKAKGLFNGEFANQLDNNAQKDSFYYNFYAKKDGSPYGSYKNRGALEPSHFQEILKYTENKIIELAQNILSGKIEVKPYRLRNNSPCGYCDYKALCRFDWQINEYNGLDALNKEQVLEKIGAVNA
ncbi:MAG: PD-(D/E)XK nuclease family protein [Planctomycetota bacterium]|jgi:ATP-dependent helicase/nuclease subunit B